MTFCDVLPAGLLRAVSAPVTCAVSAAGLEAGELCTWVLTHCTTSEMGFLN